MAGALCVTDQKGHGGEIGKAAGVPERPFDTVRIL